VASSLDCTNIALVKYWGKGQSNSGKSISHTLNNCKTITKLAFAKKRKYRYFSFDLFFEGKPKEDFKPKSKVLGANRNLLAFLKDYHFTIDTQNTFHTVLNCFSIRNGSFSDELMSLKKY
jgi:diphosphomevalonate decarboxylase